MKNYLAFLFLIISSITLAQNQTERKVYITKSKLGYITIVNDSRFEYFEYQQYSPLTIKEAIEKENKHTKCGVNYIAKAEGNGEYEIVNSKLKLNFEQYKDYAPNGFDGKEMIFEISELITE